eukprot:617435-Amorphochlora_amoeboformis.AAC.1
MLKGLVDVRDNSSSSDGSLDELVELFISADGKLKVTRSNTLDLQVLGSVSSKLENLGTEVFQDGGTVNCRGSSNAVVGLDTLLKETVNTTDRELRRIFLRLYLTGIGVGGDCQRRICVAVGGGSHHVESLTVGEETEMKTLRENLVQTSKQLNIAMYELDTAQQERDLALTVLKKYGILRERMITIDKDLVCQEDEIFTRHGGKTGSSKETLMVSSVSPKPSTVCI